jgi:hypothetical protein
MGLFKGIKDLSNLTKQGNDQAKIAIDWTTSPRVQPTAR